MKLERFSLAHKIALITGAGGLLGMQHAAAILEAGGTVILTDLHIKELERIKNDLSQIYNAQKIHLYKMDVTSKSEITYVLTNINELGMGVDILINNAAIDPKVNETNDLCEQSRLENFDLAEWNIQINVGLTGAFLCSQVFGEAMAISGKGGVILNIASDLSVIAPDQRLYRKNDLPDILQPVKPVTYSVIKAGLIGLTRYISTYWCDKGVRCNALSPGGVFNNQGKDFVVKLENLIPLGRMADVDEYKATLQYMCSDASRYMNGQNIIVDGGRSVW